MWQSRKDRGKTQNLFLIEAFPPKSTYEREYAVMGSTGNVYIVKIKAVPTCTCPDFMTRHRRCKHIYFVLIRVMGVQEGKTDTEKYIGGELLTMFDKIPHVTNHLLANGKYRDAYLKNKDRIIPKKKEARDKRDTDDLCPICLDDLENGEPLDHCKYSCGKPIHAECFQMLAKSRGAKCPFCRQSWLGKTIVDYVNVKI